MEGLVDLFGMGYLLVVGCCGLLFGVDVELWFMLWHRHCASPSHNATFEMGTTRVPTANHIG